MWRGPGKVRHSRWLFEGGSQRGETDKKIQAQQNNQILPNRSGKETCKEQKLHISLNDLKQTGKLSGGKLNRFKTYQEDEIRRNHDRTKILNERVDIGTFLARSYKDKWH